MAKLLAFLTATAATAAALVNPLTARSTCDVEPQGNVHCGAYLINLGCDTEAHLKEIAGQDKDVYYVVFNTDANQHGVSVKEVCVPSRGCREENYVGTCNA